jgi:DNA-binding GntR family transcriptional regulator
MAKKSFLALVPGAPAAADAAGGGALGDDEPRTLIEQTYARLRDDIVEGHLAPGEKLRVEHLKERYKVGAGTLREAITRLVSDALVVAEGQRGFRVAPVTIEDLEDLTSLRVHIEIDALRQSIRKGDATWRAQVQAAFEELSAIEQPLRAEQAKRWEMLNSRFHEALVAGCESAWALRVLRQLARHGERYRRYSIGLAHSGRDVHAEHRQIFELAMSGQEARAALALEAHIQLTPDLLARELKSGRDVFARR